MLTGELARAVHAALIAGLRRMHRMDRMDRNIRAAIGFGPVVPVPQVVLAVDAVAGPEQQHRHFPALRRQSRRQPIDPGSRRQRGPHGSRPTPAVSPSKSCFMLFSVSSKPFYGLLQRRNGESSCLDCMRLAAPLDTAYPLSVYSHCKFRSKFSA